MHPYTPGDEEQEGYIPYQNEDYQNPGASGSNAQGWTPQNQQQYLQYPHPSQPQYPNPNVGYMPQPAPVSHQANWGGQYGHNPESMSAYPPPQPTVPGYPSGYGSTPWTQPPSHSYPQAPQASQVHNYVALPSRIPQNTVDTYLRIVHNESDEPGSSQATARSKRAYQCVYQGCTAPPFKSKDNARVHVHKHFGADKLYECVVCRKQFASEDAAKRHRDTTDSKQYACANCGSTFARKDYKDQHQSRCPGRR